MEKYLILCVDDEREVLDSVIQDLDSFEEHFIVEAAQSVREAKEIIQQCQQDDVKLALILCDHIMPEQTGTSFLIELSQDPDTTSARKLLLTGQAGLEDTVEALNNASLDFYIAKPWQRDELVSAVTDQLTQYMIANEADLLPWVAVLDTNQMLQALSKKRDTFGE
ncbi:response regulator [Vibrio sinensis]|uniref:Response regulator n=1 Tax=Vibrio sinensis TaxID=2302434 RepID=A0A3A6QCL4_9VIBR|nr:response regulator [Vibrio sinensis]RJX69469.1 response regulator [Vibrio sinensis]